MAIVLFLVLIAKSCVVSGVSNVYDLTNELPLQKHSRKSHHGTAGN